MSEKKFDIGGRIAAFVLLLIAAALLCVQTPKVQSYIADKATAALSEALNGKLEVGELVVLPFSSVLLKDVCLIDDNPFDGTGTPYCYPPVDTVLSAEAITLTFSPKGLLRRQNIDVWRVRIDNACFNRVVEPGMRRVRCGMKPQNNLARVLGNKPPKEAKEQRGELFTVHRLKMNNLTYTQKHYMKVDKKPFEEGIHWIDNNLKVNVRAHNIKMVDGIVHGSLDKLSAMAVGGYTVKSISTDFSVAEKQARLKDFRLRDEWSDLNFSALNLNYENSISLLHFKDEVRVDARFNHTELDTRTINNLTGHKSFKPALIKINGGHYEGYINDFQVDGLNFNEPRSGVSGTVDLSLTGLPDAANSMVDARIRGLKFTTSGLSSFIGAFLKKGSPDLGKFARGKTITLDAHAKGLMNNLAVNADLRSASGALGVDGKLRNLLNSSPIEFDAQAQADNADIGALIGKDFLGETSLCARAHGILAKGNPSITIDSLAVDKLTALGYAFSGVSAEGTFKDKVIDGVLDINDPNLAFLFKGKVDLTDKKWPLYEAVASIRDADLQLLKLSKRPLRLSADIDAAMVPLDATSSVGSTSVTGVIMEDEYGRRDIGDVFIGSEKTDAGYRMSVNSDFLDMDYSGSEGLMAMVRHIQSISTKRELPSLYRIRETEEELSGNYNLNINCKDSRNVLAFLAPGVYISDNTSIDMQISDGLLNAAVQSGMVAKKKNFLKNMTLRLDNLDNSLNAEIYGEELRLAGLNLKDPAFTVFADNDTLSASIHYNGVDDAGDLGEIYLSAELERNDADSLVIHAHTLPSYVTTGAETWDIQQSDITIRGKDIDIDNFLVICGEQYISANGGISPTRPDTLRVTLQDIGLGLANTLTDKDNGISGNVCALAVVTSPTQGGFNLVSRVECDSLAIGDQSVGDLRAACSWNKASKRLVIVGKDIKDGREALSLNGTYSPSDKELKGAAVFNEFEVCTLEPFLSDLFSEMSGTLDGSIGVDGSLEDLVFKSAGTRFNDVKLHLTSTGVKYTVDGGFSLDGRKLIFDNTSLRDDAQGKGTINGAIKFDDIKSTNLGLTVDLQNMKILDLNSSEAKSFYGKLAANCHATLTGPLNSLDIFADAATSGPGNVHVPLASGDRSSVSNLLTFKEPEVYVDPYEYMLQTLETRKKAKNNFNIHANLHIDPAVEALLEIDKQTGNVISGSGEGQVGVNMHTATSDVSVNGIYTLNSGKYHFSTLGTIINKTFLIEPGSAIKFNGAIKDTDLDVKATHQLKTSLSTLIADTTSVTARKTVNCGISLSEKLSSPVIGFSINIPDLDPSTKTRVEGALNTEDKVQKQFVALLLTGSFIPDDQSGVYYNESNILYKNISNLMSGQLNNILQKLDIPVDLGLNYLRNDTGTDIFDVAVSTQLFNNRVVVNGSIGNHQRVGVQSNSDITGNVDVEIKLDQQGNYRFKLFSHSADAYTNWLDKTQRNGLGFSYQREYDKFKELFQSRKVREEFELEKERKRKTERTVIQVK